MHTRHVFPLFALLNMLAACEPAAESLPPAEVSAGPASPTAKEAAEFVAAAEMRLAGLGQYAERMAWVQYNFITQDTERLSASANEAMTAAQVEIATAAARFIGIDGLDQITARKLDMLRSGITIPAPMDAAKTAEQAEIGAKLKSLYGTGKFCRAENDCLALGELEEIIKQSQDAATLLEAWDGWHRVAVPMKDLYARQVELANEGARELGFDNLGTMWRSGYDMDPDAFALELDRIWGQLKPLYDALHCHVRARLGEVYGTDLVPQDKPIPAHLLGNMWAQGWENLYDIAGPENADVGYDLNAILQQEGFDPISMVKTGEAFFSSLGFAPLPESFWERSLFVKPADREVVCHASAWNIDEVEDLRIKMCIEVNAKDFKTIHHELGHNYYQRAYNQQSYLYRASANDGFHEAVGDTLSLSITPKYLVQIGLLDAEPDATGDIGLLLRQALEKVAFIPFGLMVDQWRWKVFAGEAGPEDYNELWWQLREQYQGVSAPNERPADAFDPGAKYHIPGNTPYSRYFLAHILQFQFFRALCEIAGEEGPIHRCSIYNSKAAGERLNAMLEMGRSQPWPLALEKLTGSKEIDATAMLDYFAPLQQWLDEQNAGRQCGW
ncbi:MAG TPA: M2 family metallopeptidase [Xanthomonadales bacterium]|nr:M2 family metallopeptidase [Xanthomonadales bacterium]